MRHMRFVLLLLVWAWTGATGGAQDSAASQGARTVLGGAKLMAFVATSDPARAKEFYQQTLGLRLVDEEPTALVFDSNGTQLRVQKVAKTQPPPATVLGWEVQDIRDTLMALRRRGVAFERFGFMKQDDLGVWTAPDGTQVAWFKDPDGNLLSVTQFPR